MDNSMITMIMENVKKAVKGKDYIIRKVLTAMLAGGHILMEDIPGVGKTTLALAISGTMDLKENRMQFTTDVLPSDVVGFSMYNSGTSEFEYRPGAIMCNLFLADEINRTSSKTQSALLEAMEEGQVTVDGITHIIPKPFVVIATQNPAGSAGTQLLPESQLDRFMVKLSMGYPDIESEISILENSGNGKITDAVEKVITADEFISMQEEAAGTYADRSIYEYIARLCSATRQHPWIELGISPRGSVAILSMAKANAYISGRNYVIPEDVQTVLHDTAVHRIVLSHKAKMSGKSFDDAMRSVLQAVPVPRKER